VRPGDAGLARHDENATSRATRERVIPVSMLADIHWHGVEPDQPDFGFSSRTLAFALDGRFTGREGEVDYQIDTDFYVVMNTWSEALRFRVPPSPTRRRWRRLIDTSLPSPEDFVPEGEGPLVSEGTQYLVAPFSMLVLISEP
jgi:glycogen operon protein